jgi:hypothetical protein
VLGLTAELARARLNQALSEGRARDARDCAVTMGVVVDKLELLSGYATSRTDARVLYEEFDRKAMVAEIEANERKLAELRARQS